MAEQQPGNLMADYSGLADSLFFPETIFNAQDLVLPTGPAWVPQVEGDGLGEPKAKRPRKMARPGAASTVPDNGNQSDSSNSAGESSNKLLDRKERNRRHARELRLRKKEYVERIEQQLKSLTAENQALQKEMSDMANVSTDRNFNWLQSLRSMLALRASAEPDEARWLQFVDKEVVLVHPITPYRSYRARDVVLNRCVLMGVHDIIQDASSLLVSMAALCKHGIHTANCKLKVQVRFTLDDDSIHCSDNGLMCPFEMRTVNLEALGARTEVSKRGSLRAVFTADKISELEMCFDPIAVWRQMQQARGESDQGDDALGASAKIASSASQGGGKAADVANEDDNLLVAPNTLTSALKPSSEARVITEATRPFRITHVNDAWVSLCGFTASEACGQTLRCLQGKETNPETVAQLVEDCNELKPTSMEVTNYDKEGRTFRNFLQVFPLADSEGTGEISHLLGVLKPLSKKGTPA